MREEDYTTGKGSRTGPFAGETAHFTANCGGDSLLLQLADGDGRSCVFTRMRKEGPQKWHIALRLRPGTYRYCYYTETNRLITYVSPRDAESTDLVMDGFHALRAVHEPPPLAAGGAV